MNPPQLLVALRPLEIKQLFDFAIRLYRQRFPAMFLALALVQLPLGLMSIVAMMKLFSVLTEVQQMTATGSEPGMDWLLQHADIGIQFGLLMLGAAAYQLLITPIGLMACARLATCALHGDSPSLGDCLRFTLKRYWPTQVVLATYALPLLLLAVLTLVLVVIGQATGSDAVTLSGALIGLNLIMLGGLAMVLLYFRFFPALTGLIQVAEDLPEGGMSNQGIWLLRRAWELTSGYFWRILGLSLLSMMAIGFIENGISKMINTLVMVFVELSRGAQGEEVLTNMMFSQYDPLSLGLSMTLATIVALIFPPFIQSYQLLLYYDLRCRKEAYDLELLLGTAPLPPVD